MYVWKAVDHSSAGTGSFTLALVTTETEIPLADKQQLVAMVAMKIGVHVLVTMDNTVTIEEQEGGKDYKDNISTLLSAHHCFTSVC